MKRFNIIFFNLFLYLFLFSFINISGFAQNTDWKIQYEPAKVFIENKGQFHIYGSEEPVLFAYDNSSSVIYFTKKGITYSFIKRWRAEKREKKREMKITSVEEWKMKELEVTAMDHVTDVVEMQWENANPDVEIIALEETPDYYSYSLKGSGDKDLNINFIKAFKKIIYKNLYPNVDVEYIFHPEDGIKYSVVLHPGADLSKIKMNYSKQPTVIDNEIHIPTLFGDIIDHAPLTFYENNHSEIITSHFNLDGSTVSFFTYPYNMSRKVIIDPWTQTPSLPNSNGVWETERDGAGNVYIIGGCMPMKLLKYNASGTLLWTYITPYDTANNWLGTFATDLAGNSFVTSGSIAKLQKISTTGSLLWNSPMPLFNTDEYWNIAFNCDQTKLIIGGTTGSMIDLYGAIFDINTSSGAVLNTQIVGSNFMWAIPPIIEEVRSITSSRNARYYFLTLDTIGAIDDDFSACGSTSPIIFRHNSGYNLAYKCETYRPNNGNSGIMSIRANRYFVYTQNGTHIQKRSLIDGAVITEASIPGGLSTASLGRNQVGNSGIDIDECGNVYVGSGNAIVKYDADLNLITSIPTSYKVSDVTVTDGGNVFYCGTTGDYNTVNRTGYLQYSNMSTCDPMTLFCCDANICPVGPLCDTDSPVTLEVSSSGGSWSGTGVSAGGVFDPAAAGIGTHTITYTLPCGESAVEITVIGCAPLYVCAEGNGDITVSAGFGPYTWSEYLPASTTPITNQAECQACGYTWMPFVNQCMNGIIPVTECASPAGYYTFATGNTVTPTGNYPIQVVDIYGNSYTITDYSLLPDCGACPTLNIMATNIVNVCAGETNGSFSVSTSGGNSPYDYTLLDGGGNTVATYINISGAQDFTGLGAGTYTLNVMDNISCPGSITITISEVSSPTPVITGPTSFCSGSSATLNAGSGYTSYNWSTGATTQSITVT
ncbi:MAG: hypothetical protein PHR81_01450, partial [Bacteroidales bacterium]|nr:hypothetical protein [Bacteroidales bacterium]